MIYYTAFSSVTPEYANNFPHLANFAPTLALCNCHCTAAKLTAQTSSKSEKSCRLPRVFQLGKKGCVVFLGHYVFVSSHESVLKFMDRLFRNHGSVLKSVSVVGAAMKAFKIMSGLFGNLGSVLKILFRRNKKFLCVSVSEFKNFPPKQNFLLPIS